MNKVTKAPCDQRRRNFLKLCGLIGLGAATGGALLPAERAEALLFGKREYKVSDTRLLLGSFFAITIIDSSRDKAQEAIGLAFGEVDRLNKLLNRHETDTPLSYLNSAGILRNAPAELIDVVNRSLYYHQLTKGAFDITVSPIVDLYKSSFSAKIQPTDTEIEALLPRIGSEHIRVVEGTILFQRPNISITLDGIAPGYIVDRVSALLTQHGIPNHLINASGDIRTSGSTIKGAPWTIAIQDPSHKKAYPDVIKMTTGAISTSGNYEIYYDKEKMFHHIVNPHTGHSPMLITSATTTASTVMAADALATSLMVMPPADGVGLISSLPKSECFIIDRDSKTIQSRGWSSGG